MQREYYRWWSEALDRDMEVLGFGYAGMRVLAFPTRVGRFFDWENWGLVETLRPTIEEGNLHLFCVDSVDAESFYCDWAHPSGRIQRHLQYERYLIEELLPFTESINNNPSIAATGCSFGAFHAANFAFRHPEIVSKMVALSGRYDLTIPIDDFRDMLDGYYDEDVYFNTPCHYLGNIEDPEILENLRRMEIIFVIGEEDPFIDNNRYTSDLLWAKGVANALHVWDGRAHRAKYWRQMLPMYL